MHGVPVSEWLGMSPIVNPVGDDDGLCLTSIVGGLLGFRPRLDGINDVQAGKARTTVAPLVCHGTTLGLFVPFSPYRFILLSVAPLLS